MRTVIHVLLALLAGSSRLLAADYYVSTTGNDSNLGTEAAPWRTIAHGLSVAVAGDVVLVRGGTYVERVSFGRSGTASDPIVLRAYPGETPILDQTGQTVPTGSGDQPIIRIVNESHITVQGFTLQNWRTSSSNALPEGILVSSNGSTVVTNVRLLGNTIHHIEQNNTGGSGDAHGIKVAGRSTAPMTTIVIDGNEVHSLRTGSSEALVVNGNVSGFRITHNVVHDCNNIGIDMIGFENGNLPPSLDRARDGICADNVVYNIDARFNPAYGGDFTLGGGDAAAAGIYVDGGSNIIVERNVVYACNFGVEIGTEESAANGGQADAITLRDNLVHHCHDAGLIMGGFNSTRGNTENCVIANNTFYQNGLLVDTVQFFGQHHIQNCVFKNNVFVSSPGTTILIGIYPSAAVTSFVGNSFLHNLYFAPTGSPQFDAQQTKSFSTWQSTTSVSGGDSGSSVGDPLFEERDPTLATAVGGYTPGPNSPMINSGQPAPGYQAGSGESDLLGRTRVRSGTVDRGAIER